MIDQLRQFLNEPLRDRDRARLFALAVGVIAATAAMLALLDRPEPQQASRTRPPVTRPRPAATAAPPSTAVAVKRPSEEGNPAAAAVASPAQIKAAKRAARRFLTGYLPYSYGQRRARTVPAASPALRRRLRERRPRVPARERRRDPRLVLVQASGVGRREAALVALVSDGARRYTVPVELERAAAGWRVTRVGS